MKASPWSSSCSTGTRLFSSLLRCWRMTSETHWRIPHGLNQQIQNKRGIVSKETEALCRRGVLQNKLGFINWVDYVNWSTLRNAKAEVLSVSPSSELIATQLIKPLKWSTDFSFEFWKHLSRASFTLVRYLPTQFPKKLLQLPT